MMFQGETGVCKTLVGLTFSCLIACKTQVRSTQRLTHKSYHEFFVIVDIEVSRNGHFAESQSSIDANERQKLPNDAVEVTEYFSPWGQYTSKSAGLP